MYFGSKERTREQPTLVVDSSTPHPTTSPTYYPTYYPFINQCRHSTFNTQSTWYYCNCLLSVDVILQQMLHSLAETALQIDQPYHIGVHFTVHSSTCKKDTMKLLLLSQPRFQQRDHIAFMSISSLEACATKHYQRQILGQVQCAMNFLLKE